MFLFLPLMVAYYTQGLYFLFPICQCILEPVPGCQIKVFLFYYWKSNFLGGSPKSSWALPWAKLIGSKWPACPVCPREPRMWSLRFPSLAHRIGTRRGPGGRVSLVNKWRQKVQRKQGWKSELCSTTKDALYLSFTDLQTHILPETFAILSSLSLSNADGFNGPDK